MTPNICMLCEQHRLSLHPEKNIATNKYNAEQVGLMHKHQHITRVITNV